MQQKKIGTDGLITSILNGIEDVKGIDINLLDLREIENTVCDYFVICNGTSNIHVNAIVSAVQKKVFEETHDKPWHVEGNDGSEWVLIDYVNVVVHVFQKHKREFYDIEGLWGDAKVTLVETTY